MNQKKRDIVLIACYNWDKRVLGLPSEEFSLYRISKLEFDLNAPAFSVRRDLIAYDLSLILWKRILESSGSHNSLTDIDGFRHWLRNTVAGQTVFSEALKIADARLSKELTYENVFKKSVEAKRAERLSRILDVLLLTLVICVVMVLAVVLMALISKMFIGI